MRIVERVFPNIALHSQASGRHSTTNPPLTTLPDDLTDLVLPELEHIETPVTYLVCATHLTWWTRTGAVTRATPCPTGRRLHIGMARKTCAVDSQKSLCTVCYTGPDRTHALIFLAWSCWALTPVVSFGHLRIGSTATLRCVPTSVN